MLIQSDIDFINTNAAFSAEQRALFDLLLRGSLTDIGIMHALHIGNRRYYRLKRQLIEKLDRLMRDGSIETTSK